MYYAASKVEFMIALLKAGQNNRNIQESCTAPHDLPDNAEYYLHADEKSGFGLVCYDNEDVELIAVFSCVKGRGQGIMDAAEELGANYLDHFDGYLTEFYAARGWVEYKREPNWVAGGPDVVYRTTITY